MHGPLRLTPQIDHHNRAMGGAADAVDQITHQPGPQLITAASSHQKEIRRLLDRRAAHATSDVFIEPQQASGGHLQIGPDHFGGGQPAAGRCNGTVEAATHLRQAWVHHRQRQQQPLATG